VLIFWVYTPCNIGGINQRFGGTYYLSLQGSSTLLRNFVKYMHNTRPTCEVLGLIQ